MPARSARSSRSPGRKNPQAKRPRKVSGLSDACARGSHSVCTGLVYKWPVPETGERFAVCLCPECQHPGTTTVRRPD